MLGKDQMPRLLATERQIPLLHFLHHVLVADLRANQFDVQVSERDLEPDVAHHGRDHGIAAKPAVGLHLLGAHQHHVVAVDDAAAGVDQDGAIAVAVERDAESEIALPHDLGQHLRMRRAHAFVDVPAIGIRPEERDLETQLAKQRRRHRRHRAVRAIDGDADAAQRVRPGQDGPRVLQVLPQMVRERDVGGFPAGTCHDASATRCSIRSSKCPPYFTPAPEKTLIPLS